MSANDADRAMLDECAETDEQDSEDGIDPRKFLAELVRKNAPDPF